MSSKRRTREVLPAGTACCLLDVTADGREPLLSRMLEALRAQSAIRDARMVLSLLLERERLGSTAVGEGVAIPHARSLGVSEITLVVATSRRGIAWTSDGDPVHLVFLVLAPSTERARKPYLELIARIAERTRLARDRKRLLEAKTAEEVTAALGGSP